MIVERNAFSTVPSKDHVLLVAVTTNPRSEKLPFCVALEPGKRSGLIRRSYLNASHMHAFSKGRLQKRLGTLSPEEMSRVDEALRLILDL